jgi:hypothetical protein
VRFPHVTALADMAARHLAEKQGKPCSKSTLLRNSRYKVLLEGYFLQGAQQRSRPERSQGSSETDITTLQLENGNLKRENERLKSYIEIQPQVGSNAPRQVPDAARPPRGDSASIDLHNVCQALFMVLKHLETQLALDEKRESIVDLARLRNNEVVPAQFIAAFVRWLDTR